MVIIAAGRQIPSCSARLTGETDLTLYFGFPSGHTSVKRDIPAGVGAIGPGLLASIGAGDEGVQSVHSLLMANCHVARPRHREIVCRTRWRAADAWMAHVVLRAEWGNFAIARDARWGPWYDTLSCNALHCIA